jgi:hypothetical protein
MPNLVDDPRLARLEKLVEALHSSKRVDDPAQAFRDAEAEAARREGEVDSDELFHLTSRLGRYRFERYG